MDKALITGASSVTADSVPRLGGLFRLQWESAQGHYVLLYPEGMVRLNGAAGEILALVDGTRSVETIIATLQAKFPGFAELADDVVDFLGDAYEQHWITL